MQGMDERSEPIAQALLRGPLALRNSAAIRYRMRNISAVVRELGVQTLHDFSPAESIGSGVRPRIRAMLLENRDFERLRTAIRSTTQQRRQEAIIALGALRERIAEIEHDLALLGHNNPPDVIGAEGLDREQFRQALDDVDALEREVTAQSPNLALVRRSKSRLIRFAVSLAKWLGVRGTKFVDAALLTAAPIVTAKVLGVLPSIVTALEAATKSVGH
jgi:predicted lactoylglutathione lyase